MQQVVLLRHFRATVTKNVYPPSTAFQGTPEELDKILVGGHSLLAVKAATMILTDFMNAIEKGEEIEVRD